MLPLAWLGVWSMLQGPGSDPDPAVDLQWTAPAGCPTRDEVQAGIDARIVQTPEKALAGPTRAEILVSAAADRYVATLVVDTDDGRTTRHLEAQTCATVTDAAVLIVAMIHAQRMQAVIGDPPAPTVTEPCPVCLPTPKPTVVSAPPPPRPRTQAGVLAEFGLGFSGLPGIGLGVGLGAALLRPRLRAELVGRLWQSRDTAIGPAGGVARVDAALGTVGLYAGPVLRAGPVELVLMAGAQVGAVRGRGEGVESPQTAYKPWVSVGGQLVVLWPLHPRVAIGGRAGFEGVVVRPRFAVSDGGEDFTVAPVTGTVAAVVEVRLGRARGSNIR